MRNLRFLFLNKFVRLAVKNKPNECYTRIGCKLIEKDIPKDICSCYQHGKFVCKFCCKKVSETIESLPKEEIDENKE